MKVVRALLIGMVRLAGVAAGVIAMLLSAWAALVALSRCAGGWHCDERLSGLGVVASWGLALLLLISGATAVWWAVWGRPPRLVQAAWDRFPTRVTNSLQRAAAVAAGGVLLAQGVYGLYAAPACAIRGCDLSPSEVPIAMVFAVAASAGGVLLIAFGITGRPLNRDKPPTG